MPHVPYCPAHNLHWHSVPRDLVAGEPCPTCGTPLASYLVRSFTDGDFAERGVYEFVCEEDGTRVRLDSPCWEPDADDETGDITHIPVWDKMLVPDGAGGWRDATEEESDEYGDDLRDHLRSWLSR